MTAEIQRFQDQTIGEIRAALSPINGIISKLNQDNIATQQAMVKFSEAEYWINQALMFTCNLAAQQAKQKEQANSTTVEPIKTEKESQTTPKE